MLCVDRRRTARESEEAQLYIHERTQGAEDTRPECSCVGVYDSSESADGEQQTLVVTASGATFADDGQPRHIRFPFPPPPICLLLDGSQLCMDASVTSVIDTATSVFESATPAPELSPSDSVPAHHASPVVAFIIGLAITLLASILNAAGLNLTKLDHVSSSLICEWKTASEPDRRIRCAPAQYPNLHGDETGYDPYGCLECYCICE